MATRRQLATDARRTDDDAYPVVVIAASAGGLTAVSELLGMLPADLRSAIVVVQHLHPDHVSQLAEILRRRCDLPVEQAVEGARLRPGTVLVAPPDRHVEFTAEGTVALTTGPPVRFVRPSADVTFASAARVYGARTVAIVLTGTGSDGSAGTLDVHAAGGLVIVQREDTAEYPGMPSAAREHGWVDRQETLDGIAEVLAEHAEVTGGG